MEINQTPCLSEKIFVGIFGLRYCGSSIFLLIFWCVLFQVLHLRFSCIFFEIMRRAFEVHMNQQKFNSILPYGSFLFSQRLHVEFSLNVVFFITCFVDFHCCVFHCPVLRSLFFCFVLLSVLLFQVLHPFIFMPPV